MYIYPVYIYINKYIYNLIAINVTHVHLVPILGISGAVPLLYLCAFLVCTETAVQLTPNSLSAPNFWVPERIFNLNMPCGKKNNRVSFTRSGQYYLRVCVYLLILTTLRVVGWSQQKLNGDLLSDKVPIFLSAIICCNAPWRNFITESRKLSLQEIGFFFWWMRNLIPWLILLWL